MMSGALHKLSARQVETASEPKRYGDGGGLYLSVKSKTSKSPFENWLNG